MKLSYAIFLLLPSVLLALTINASDAASSSSSASASCATTRPGSRRGSPHQNLLSPSALRSSSSVFTFERTMAAARSSKVTKSRSNTPTTARRIADQTIRLRNASKIPSVAQPSAVATSSAYAAAVKDESGCLPTQRAWTSSSSMPADSSASSSALPFTSFRINSAISPLVPSSVEGFSEVGSSSHAVVLDITQSEIAEVMKDKRWRRETEGVVSEYTKNRANIALMALQADPDATVENVKDGVKEIIGKKVNDDAAKRAAQLGVELNSNFLINTISNDLGKKLYQDQRDFETYNSKNPSLTMHEYIKTQGCVHQ